MGKHQLPHRNDLVSKTIVRPRNCCRVVITLEAEVHLDRMKELPSYMTHAADFLRDAIIEPELNGYLSGILREFFLEHDVFIHDTQVEVGP